MGVRVSPGAPTQSAEQLTADVGLFARAGWTPSGVEEVDFTDIDQTLSSGLPIAGAPWGRPDDTVGTAAAFNQISRNAKDYLAGGGLGGIIGDGQLPASGPEQIFEAHYSLAAFSYARISGDYQFINNPAYNCQRGPVSVFALLSHAQF